MHYAAQSVFTEVVLIYNVLWSYTGQLNDMFNKVDFQIEDNLINGQK